MDRITKSYLSEFSKSFGFESETDETRLFEHFVNYTIVDKKSEERFDVEELNIGKDSTFGLDGFALILNKSVMNTIDEITEFLNEHSDISAEVVFIQSKTSKGFDTKEIGNFGWAITDFISEEQKIQWSDIAKEKIELFNILITNSSKLRTKPVCQLYYVALGIKSEDKNVNAKVEDIKNNILSENLFSKLTFELMGANEIQINYRKIGQTLKKSFEFTQKITLPEINQVEESYLGILKVKTIVDLMTDDNGELISNVFYDNVRDYQGENNVNVEIADSLKSSYKDAFLILNNGITIVVEELETTRNTFTISNYQIINGCQTSNVIFDNRSIIDDSIMVPVKLISSKNQDITGRLIRSTNRQTAVKEQDLIAFSNFQKKLEDYYKTYSGGHQLYYERRSKQYERTPVDNRKIIDKTTQIKAVASFFFDKPDLATRYFGSLFADLGSDLFKDGDQLILYYTSSLALYKIDEAFRNNKIDKKYKKIKYFLLMMFRYECNKTTPPPFNSRKMENYCNEIIRIVNNELEFNKLLNNILRKINSLNVDLNDKELSKSKIFAKNCLDKYLPRAR
jgi:AIPR protein